MKTIYSIGCIVLFIFFYSSVAGQSYKHFRLDAGLGLVGAGNLDQGPVFYLGASWRINDRFLIGPRVEIVYADAKKNDQINGVTSFSFYGQYFMPSKQGVRPFVGAGIGFYTSYKLPTKCDCSFDASSNVPGFYPRIGFEVSHFVVSIDYHLMARTRAVSHSIIPLGPQSQPDYVSYTNTNYLSVRVGLFIGGGRRKKL